MQGKYKQIYDSSIIEKENFWKEVAENIFWYKKPKKGLTVIWPAIWTHTHKGLPAPKELKYICTGWYEWKNNLS